MRSYFSLKGRRALIVEDEPFVRSVIVRIIREMGEPSLEVAEHGAQALEALETLGDPFDFALLDFNMPGPSGLDVLKAVRCGKSRTRRDLPVAMLTGNADRDLVDAAMALDVNALLLKPASQKTLSGRIERMLTEESELQEIEVYLGVDVKPSPLQRLAAESDGRSAPTTLRPLAPRMADVTRPMNREISAPKAMLGPRLRKSINDLKTGFLVAEDVVSPRGARLVAAGVTLNNRTLARLQDLAEMNEIEHVWVHAPITVA